jgi:hypothetical protein
MSDARAVVVVTMPRSGSSLLAGVLHRLGVPMGAERDLAMGRHLNRHGCHEDQDFQRISLNILFEARLLLDLTRRLDIDEDRLAAAVQRWEPEIRRFVAARTAPVWGFKDPALTYALPHLAHYLPDPIWIHLERDPAATARSLFRTFRPEFWWPELREKMPLLTWRNRLRIVFRALGLRLMKGREYQDDRFFEEVIRAGHRRARGFLEGRSHRTLALTDLVEAPEATIDRLAEFLPVDPTPDRRAEALRFIQPDLLSAR